MDYFIFLLFLFVHVFIVLNNSLSKVKFLNKASFQNKHQKTQNTDKIKEYLIKKGEQLIQGCSSQSVKFWSW